MSTRRARKWAGATSLALLVWGAVPRGGLGQTPSTGEKSVVTITLRWASIPGAMAYDIQVAREPAFESPLVNERVTQNQLAWTPKQVGIFYWRVRGIDRFARAGMFSGAKAFEVGPSAKVHPGDTTDDSQSSHPQQNGSSPPHRGSPPPQDDTSATQNGSSPPRDHSAPTQATMDNTAASAVNSMPTPLIDPEVTNPTPVPPPPPSPEWLLGSRVGVSLISAEWQPSLFWSISGAYRAPWWHRLLGARVELSVIQTALSGKLPSPEPTTAYPWALSLRTISLTTDIFATWELGPFSPYGGVGGGIYFLHASVDALGQTNTEDQVRAGLHLRGGTDYPLGPGAFIVEVRYHYVDSRFQSTGASTVGGFTFNAGYRLRI